MKSLRDASVGDRHTPVLKCCILRRGKGVLKYSKLLVRQPNLKKAGWLRTPEDFPSHQGGPGKGGTGHTIAHTPLDRKRRAETWIDREGAEIDLGSRRWASSRAVTREGSGIHGAGKPRITQPGTEVRRPD